MPRLICGGWYDSLKYDINEQQPDVIVQLDMAQLISKTIKGTPLCKFHHRYNHERILSMRSVTDAALPAGDNGVSIETNNGRLFVTLMDYIERIYLDRPTYVVAMADEVPYAAGKKRLTNAVRRTQQWFTQLQQSPKMDWSTSFLIGVIVGNNKQQYHESITSQTQFLLSNGAQGLLLGGLGQGESLEERTEVISLVKEARGSSLCPIFLQGLQSIEEILHALSCEIEYISTDYPAIITKAGLALSLVFHPKSECDSNSPRKRQRILPPLFRQDDVHLLNLWDPIYSRDTSALVIDCSCHACRNYSRAYLHHLLICHELLAEVMLYNHNFHTLLLLFDTCSIHV